MKTLYQQLFANFASAWVIYFTACTAFAQVNTNQINWGSLDESVIVDSQGNVLTNDPNLRFDLGAFREGFTPTESNVNDWYDNWFTFDSATYNPAGGVFVGQYTMYDNFNDGDFDSNDPTFGLGISRDAYIWVYNSTDPVPGTEWFIARAINWAFPTLADDCCNNDIPIQWSMSDLEIDTTTPLWGNVFGREGSGERETMISNADLQTYTFIPEPSSALLLLLAGLFGVTRRSRQ